MEICFFGECAGRHDFTKGNNSDPFRRNVGNSDWLDNNGAIRLGLGLREY